MAYHITEACSGCTSCAAVCTTGAVSGQKKALHRIDEKTCIECDACGKVCPEGAIEDASGRIRERLKRAAWEKPFFDEQKCNGCSICLDVCPVGCISLGVPGRARPHACPAVTDLKKCIGCGFCAAECPVDAIEMGLSSPEGKRMADEPAAGDKSMKWALKKAAYRAVQKGMKRTARFIPIPIPVLLTGPGSVTMLAENIRARGLKHVLVVTDKVLVNLKLLDGFLASLRKEGIAYTLFDDVQPNPTIENVEAGRKIYRQNRCEGLVAFGGGSSMDCAKIIGARVRNPYLSVRMMKGIFRVIIPIPPFFCIPTTAGTGSEATVSAVITDTASHYKFLINDFKLVPKIAVLDPELMRGLPPPITSSTGMDALTHAIEAYINLSGTLFTDENAENAVKLIFENLEKVYLDGNDIDGRRRMALASFYAGVAITRAFVGYVHAIAHNMGGLYGVPHGLANAVILPYVLEFFREVSQKKLARLAVVGGIGTQGESDEALSYRFIEKITTMNRNMKIPTIIEALKESDIPLIARRALKEAHPLYPVPMLMTQKACEEIVRKLLA
jgi:alcohol dehydrogenase